ncbi:hypothetical protein M758_9G082000 [Ceratodon purpureus]|nr:hypothetical protein M758_9G082000 [Ceratodon purpureus]
MEDCDGLHPPGWWPQFRPPDDAESNEEVLRPFYDALEACPPDTKLHCAIRFGRGFEDSLELSGIDKSAQGQSYWEQCKDQSFDSYRPHGTGAMQPMIYSTVYPSSRFSGDEWASIVNAVTNCPVLEELEIQVYRSIDSTIIEVLLSRVSAVRVLGLRIWCWGGSLAAVVAKSIRKMKTLERLVLNSNEAERENLPLEQLFGIVSSPSVSQTEDQIRLNEFLWIYAGGNLQHLYEVFITLLRNSRLKTIELYTVSNILDSVHHYYSWSYQELIGIFETLQGNKCLKKLDIKYLPTKRIGNVRKIVGKLLDLVDHDFYVEKINLPLDTPDEFRRVEEQVKKNAVNGLKGMELISPESSRVFLCGLQFAGKTQLRSTFGKEHRFFKRLVNELRNIPRTSGIEVTRLDIREAKFSFWDFGGQVDYHFLHDLFIPGGKHNKVDQKSG